MAAAVEIGDIRELIEAAVTAVSILGGLMAYFSGRAASASIVEGAQVGTVAQRVNEGLAAGFDWGIRLAAITFIIVL